jgi:hypothetical protein
MRRGVEHKQTSSRARVAVLYCSVVPPKASLTSTGPAMGFRLLEHPPQNQAAQPWRHDHDHDATTPAICARGGRESLIFEGTAPETCRQRSGPKNVTCRQPCLLPTPMQPGAQGLSYRYGYSVAALSSVVVLLRGSLYIKCPNAASEAPIPWASPRHGSNRAPRCGVSIATALLT